MTDEMTDEQVVPFFGTPTNVTDTTPFRQLRRRVGYVHAERLAGWYLRMRDMAKQGRVFGEFVTDTVSFVESLDAPVPDVDDESPEFLAWFAERASIWQAFDDVGLIDIVAGDPSKVDDRFRVCVVDFHETNSPRMSERNNGRRTRMSDEERRAKDRERKRRKRAEEKHGPMPAPEPCPADVRGTSVSAPIQTVQTEETEQTTTPQPPAPLNAVRSSWSGEDRYEQEQTARLDVQRPDTPLSEVKAAQQRIETQLARMLVNPQDAVTMAELIATTKRRNTIGKPPRVYDIAVWERAVNVLVRQVVDEGRTVTGDPMGLLVAMVPNYEAEGSDRKVLVREVVPNDAPVEETVEQIRARFEREAEERAS